MSSEKKENNHLQIDEKSNQTKTTSPNQSTKMTTTTSAATATNEMSINCNLYTEYTDADEKLFARADLTEHQLKLKDQDPAAFWKSVNENVRSNLQDALVDNEEVRFMISYSLKSSPSK